MKIKTLLIGAILLGFAPQSFAWGRRGHSIVCQSAAYLIASEPKAGFLRNQSFDLGYYCNTPDIIWKDNPDTAKQEWFNHFMDLEIFDRYLRGKEAKAFELDRVTFEKTYPDISVKAGRAYWRIREVFDQLMDFKAKLSGAKLKVEEQHALQAEWLLRAGVIGHYVGDLSQPLHVTENHNGEITKQKGIHSYFEDVMVNELFEADQKNLELDSFSAAQKRWKKERGSMEKKSVLQLLEDLSRESSKDLPELLKIDRKIGRDNIEEAKKAYRPMLVARLAAGALYLAELYRRGVGFDFNSERFFKFYGSPKFIPNPSKKELVRGT